MIPAPVSNQPTACTRYTLPPVPETVHHTVIILPRACQDYSLPLAQGPAQHAGSGWGEPQHMAVQPAYIQSPTQHQMLPTQPAPAPAQMPNMPMTMPVGTRVSMRVNKGQTSKNNDFVQQITLKPGTYASDGNNLYMLEDIGNTSSIRNMLTAYPTWQQKINQTWPPDTANNWPVRATARHPCRPPTGTPTCPASRGS